MSYPTQPLLSGLGVGLRVPEVRPEQCVLVEDDWSQKQKQFEILVVTLTLQGLVKYILR